MIGRQKIAMIIAEFLGTTVLAVAVYSMVARTSFPLFAGLAAGLCAALFTVTVGHISGAHLNPAVTIGLWSMRKIAASKAVVFIAAQMLGGLAAWMLIKYLIGQDIEALASSKFEGKVFVAEALGAFIFTFGVAAALLEKLSIGRTALVIGGSLLLGILVASLGSNGVVNPAVALGIQSWNWAYATGPLLGGILGVSFYGLVFNPDALGIGSSVRFQFRKSSSSKVAKKNKSVKVAKTAKTTRSTRKKAKK